MRRWSYFLYGLFCHLLFLAIVAYMTGFVGNVLVPKSIDTPSALSLPAALAVNLSLIALFGLQHSIMARPAFKARWTRLVPEPIERSTYVLISCLVTALLMWQWQGIPLVIWDVQNSLSRLALWALFALGWLLVPAASLMIDHFDLFGTRQVWLYLLGQEHAPPEFRTPLLYGWVRHPIYVGWALAFWATPTMTLGHLTFAGALTIYMLIATRYEERDLVEHYGEAYRDYQRRVPRFVPRIAGSTEKELTSKALPIGSRLANR